MDEWLGISTPGWLAAQINAEIHMSDSTTTANEIVSTNELAKRRVPAVDLTTLLSGPKPRGLLNAAEQIRRMRERVRSVEARVEAALAQIDVVHSSIWLELFGTGLAPPSSCSTARISIKRARCLGGSLRRQRTRAPSHAATPGNLSVSLCRREWPVLSHTGSTSPTSIAERHRSHPPWRQSRGFAHPTTNQIRIGHQPQDSQGARPRCPTDAPCPRRAVLKQRPVDVRGYSRPPRSHLRRPPPPVTHWTSRCR
jgi:hypothetical protein